MLGLVMGANVSVSLEATLLGVVWSRFPFWDLEKWHVQGKPPVNCIFSGLQILDDSQHESRMPL